jgi:hypothetical protein
MGLLRLCDFFGTQQHKSKSTYICNVYTMWMLESIALKLTIFIWTFNLLIQNNSTIWFGTVQRLTSNYFIYFLCFLPFKSPHFKRNWKFSLTSQSRKHISSVLCHLNHVSSLNFLITQYRQQSSFPGFCMKLSVGPATEVHQCALEYYWLPKAIP